MNQNEMHILSPRGVLALLVHPKHHRLPASVISNGVSSIRTEATRRLNYFETDSIAPRLTRSYKRRRKKEEEFSTEDLESQSLTMMSSSPNSSQRFYHPREGEFTLFYFCEMNCNNSRRFTMILANFMQAMDKDDQNESTRDVQACRTRSKDASACPLGEADGSPWPCGPSCRSLRTTYP